MIEVSILMPFCGPYWEHFVSSEVHISIIEAEVTQPGRSLHGHSGRRLAEARSIFMEMCSGPKVCPMGAS